MPSEITLAHILVPAIAALLGVVAGGYITAHNQSCDRRQRRIREQIDGFYGPMVGIRQEILAKSELRAEIEQCYQEMLSKLKEHSREDRSREQTARSDETQKRIDYNNQQLRYELLPAYKRLRDHFSKNMSLAESSAREHFPELVKYIEAWNRQFARVIPLGIELGYNEEKLAPFYEDLESELARLSKLVKK